MHTKFLSDNSRKKGKWGTKVYMGG